ncbi:MAG: helix-turn-helix transcriptional regulator, partial [Xanthomonadales bacterium]|nr:helix-turn-helix transcriptional regulator [Xanthomonadales bacterium]
MSSRRRQKAERPAQLLEAAFALFLERGFAATRIDDIAERAQVSKGTVYLYYPSKEALLTAAVEELLLPRLANL